MSLLLLMLVTIMAPLSSNKDNLLFGFEESTDASAWQSVNDNVMGGISDGRFEVTDEGVLRFYGKVSLENNGGFASLRSITRAQDLSSLDGILIRVKGDGKQYDFNIRTDFPIMAGSYRQKFETRAGVWQQIFLPFESFQATSFGQALRNAPRVNAREVRSLGLTISDKQAGPFQLHADWIKATKKPTKIEEQIVNAGCASCIFHMKNVTGCKLALYIDGKQHLVEGSGIADHGDAHASNVLCSAARWAIMNGITMGDRLIIQDMRLLP